MNTETRNAIDRLSARANCLYIDHRTVAKQTVYNSKQKLQDYLTPSEDTFTVSTCLRLEIYHLGNSNPETPHNFLFNQIRGKLAVRRLISLMSGMQSEIVGEMEIFKQVMAGIRATLDAKQFKHETFWDLLEVVRFSLDLRARHILDCEENYSTVGADMFNKLMADFPGVVGIIGCGYMAEYFMRAISLNRAERVFWINRNVIKAMQLQKELAFLENVNLQHVALDESLIILKECDYIFAAASNIGHMFDGKIFNRAKIIVDVSYPSLFSEYANPNLRCINNTYFESHIRNPVKKHNLLQAEHELDGIF